MASVLLSLEMAPAPPEFDHLEGNGWTELFVVSAGSVRLGTAEMRDALRLHEHGQNYSLTLPARCAVSWGQMAKAALDYPENYRQYGAQMQEAAVSTGTSAFLTHVESMPGGGHLTAMMQLGRTLRRHGVLDIRGQIHVGIPQKPLLVPGRTPLELHVAFENA